MAINGYTRPDPQLSAILHSSINVFSSLPDNRPDLPVSYFSRFLFSEVGPAATHPQQSLVPSCFLVVAIGAYDLTWSLL